MKTIYLAGPDVFFPGPSAHFDKLEALCRMHGLQGLRPSDGGLSKGASGTGDEISERIYQANVELLRRCDGVLANLQPFRNPLEADSGTVFEVGFAVALGRPVAAVLPDLTKYEDRVIRHCGCNGRVDGVNVDREGFMIEEFGQPLNLMLARSISVFDHTDKALAHLASLLN